MALARKSLLITLTVVLMLASIAMMAAESNTMFAMSTFRLSMTATATEASIRVKFENRRSCTLTILTVGR